MSLIIYCGAIDFGRALGPPAGSLGVALGVPDGLRWLQVAPECPRWCQIVPEHGRYVSEFNHDPLNSKIMQ